MALASRTRGAHVPRSRGLAMPPVFDGSVPTLLMKIGRYPLHHGAVGAARSLGRVGVPVFAVTEDRHTPTALSRYVRKAFVWPTSGREEPEELIAELIALSERIGTRAVLLTTDDEAAILAAEHAHALTDRFIVPSVAADLLRRLNSKFELAQMCAATGIGAPRSFRPQSVGDLFEAARAIGYPLVLKNDAAWDRITQPAVRSTAVVRSDTELERLSSGWAGSMPRVAVQELLPHEETVDWSVAIYCGRESDCVLALTGRKVRSFPAYAGVTAVGLTVANEELREQAVAFCRTVGFRGIGSLDWRFDRRDGRYKLLDFNIRIGAMFRMFETAQGIDVARAMHLDVTGRPVPLAREIQNRRYVVGNLALPVSLAYRHDRAASARALRTASDGVERAWLASDDPLPGLVAAIRTVPKIRAFRPWRGASPGAGRIARGDASARAGGRPVT
jgi:predicted ATP-grasp superfamily ATP-dependent carboligase